MSRKTDVYQKWKKISQKTKKTYMFLEVPFQRILPLMIILIIINGSIMGDSFKNLDSVIVFIFIKLIFAYILGVIIGHCEWNFFRKMSEGEYKKKSEIRNQYLLIYGLLFFGFTIMISELEYPYKSINLMIIQLIIWPLSGLLWGSMMWLVIGNGLNRYLKKEE